MKNVALVMSREEIKEHVQKWAYNYNRRAEYVNQLRIQADAEPDEKKRYELMLTISSLDFRANAAMEKLNGKFDMLAELTDVFIFVRLENDYPTNYRQRGGTLNALIKSVVYDWQFGDYQHGAVEELPVYSVQENA